MEITTIKCPQCDADINLEETRDFGFCTYCGTKVIRECSVDSDENTNNELKSEKTINDASDSIDITAESVDIEENISKALHNKKPVIIVIAALLLVALLGSVLVCNVFIPNSKYKKAIELKEKDSYDEAIAIFSELGDYKDSSDLINEIKAEKEEARINALINNAQSLYDSGDKLGAYQMLLSEKQNEAVSEMLAKYKNEILNQANSNIEWDDARSESYRYATIIDGDTIELPAGPSVNFALQVSKNNPSEKRIFLEYAVIQSLAGNNLPSHPVSVVFENGTDRIELPARYNDVNIEVDYSIGGWWEIGGVIVTLEQANAIVEMFSSNQNVSMSLVGVSRQRNYVLGESEAQALKEMAEYLNIVYSLE